MSARRGLYGDIFIFKHVLININHDYKFNARTFRALDPRPEMIMGSRRREIWGLSRVRRPSSQMPGLYPVTAATITPLGDLLTSSYHAGQHALQRAEHSKLGLGVGGYVAFIAQRRGCSPRDGGTRPGTNGSVNIMTAVVPHAPPAARSAASRRSFSSASSSSRRASSSAAHTSRSSQPLGKSPNRSSSRA